PLNLVEELRALAAGLAGADATARADLLPLQARALLEAAVVAGGDVPTAVLAHAAGLDDVGRALAELSLHGFIRATQQRLELPSPSLRQKLYDGIEHARRQKLHATLASLLETRGAEPITVAHHA